MKQNEEKKIKSKKLIITLLELAIVVGCIFIIYILMTPKDRVKDSTYSYSKLEEVKEYEIQGEYITRVRPLTEYTTFKETAEYTLNHTEDEITHEDKITYTLKVYTDSSKTQEVTEGYITSGMVLEGIPTEDKETGEQTVTYTICVIGDFTKDGDINITELTKIIKGVVGLKDWTFTEEEKLIADFNGDKEVNVVDIEECINYIVYGKLTIENGTKLKATDENGITWNYTYQDGKAIKVYYESGKLGEKVIIPSELDGHAVVSLYNDAESGYGSNIFTSKNEYPKNTIKEIIIPKGLLRIGDGAFASCTSLTKIEIPDSVIKIGNRVFYGCTSLASIEIPDSVISIGSSAFNYCTSLTSTKIPDSVTSIGYNAFYYCTSLTSIEIPDSVTSIGSSAFYNTAWYNNQPDGLVYAGKVAYKYKGKMPENTIIKLKEDTKGIAGEAFKYCTSLTSIGIPDSVISIGDWAFYYCTSLTSIEIPDSVTSIEARAFDSCINLASIEIPDSVISIGYEAFYNTAWYNYQPDGVIYAGKVAYEYKGKMPENTNIELKEGTKGIAGGAFYSDGNLMNITIPNSVIRIGDSAFYDCTSLSTVTMSKNIEYIGQAAFADCTSLNNIVIWKNVNDLGHRTFDRWKDNQTINIETNEIPDGWHDNWNYRCNAQVVYGYTAE